MPQASPLFNEMTKRVRKLKSKYMARQVKKEMLDPINYKFDILNTAAYQLLVHAEIEEYIEAKALQVLKEIEVDVKRNGYGTAYFKNLLAIANELDEPLSITAPYDESEFKTVVERLIKKAVKQVSDNNGIKSNSFSKLALFSGYDRGGIDPFLLSSITAYGKRRGSVAHKGPRHVTTFLSPSSEVKDAEDILMLLRMHYYNF